MKPFKNFGCMDAWVLNPEGWDRFGWRLMPVGSGGIMLAEGLHDWRTRAVPLFKLYLGICLTTEEEHGNLSQGSRLVLRRLCVDFVAFLGAASTGLLSMSSSVARWWLQSVLGWHKCPSRCPTTIFESKLLGQCSDVVGEEWNPENPREFACYWRMKPSVALLLYVVRLQIYKYPTLPKYTIPWSLTPHDL
jgi:hypothetical protein